MSYCTLEEIKINRIPEDRLIALTDADNVNVVNENSVNGAIADADDIIDSLLRGRYTVPLATTPGIIRTIALDLATYALYGLNPAFDIPKTVADRYTTAMKLLMQIQDGKMQLFDESEQITETGSTGQSSQNGQTFQSAQTRLFTRTTLKRY